MTKLVAIMKEHLLTTMIFAMGMAMALGIVIGGRYATDLAIKDAREIIIQEEMKIRDLKEQNESLSDQLQWMKETHYTDEEWELENLITSVLGN